MTKIVNLTPHPINLVGLGEIKPSGKPVRLEEKTPPEKRKLRGRESCVFIETDETVHYVG